MEKDDAVRLIPDAMKIFSNDSKDEAKITLIGVEDKPGVAANIFEPLNKAQINVDMVIQNISSDQKITDITFTIKRDDLLKTIEILKNNNKINATKHK